ncbi:MAG: hypothetical protein V7721_11625 [Porticoccaceae bacterium]
MKHIIILTCTIFIVSCASDLKIYDSAQNEIKGVPFNMPQLVEIASVTKYKVAKGSEKFKALCTPEENTKLEFMPLGKQYYVNFDAAELGDGEFSVEYTDKGLLKSITLNSKASAGAEQANALLSTILPFIKAPKVTPSEKSLIGADDIAEKLKAKHCLKSGTKITGVKKIEIQ